MRGSEAFSTPGPCQPLLWFKSICFPRPQSLLLVTCQVHLNLRDYGHPSLLPEMYRGYMAGGQDRTVLESIHETTMAVWLCLGAEQIWGGEGGSRTYLTPLDGPSASQIKTSGGALMRPTSAHLSIASQLCTNIASFLWVRVLIRSPSPVRTNSHKKCQHWFLKIWLSTDMFP